MYIHFAPLQGYTDRVYREAHAEVFGGVNAYYTPFVRIEKDGFRKKDVRDIAPLPDSKANVVPQLIASTPEEFRQVASLFAQAGYQRVDINLGCPFPMQVKQYRGSGLLPHPEECAGLLRTIHEFPALSFSVKMRLGWERSEESLALLPVLNDLPLVHIALHPRLGIQQYKGTVDGEGFAAFQSACRHPLFYNGDLFTLEDIGKVEAGFPALSGVMIGRGLLAHPWLALEHQTGTPLSDVEKGERLHRFHSLLLEQYSTLLEGGEHQVLSKMKTLWDYLLPEADKKLRKRVLKSTTLTAYKGAVRDLLD